MKSGGIGDSPSAGAVQHPHGGGVDDHLGFQAAVTQIDVIQRKRPGCQSDLMHLVGKSACAVEGAVGYRQRRGPLQSQGVCRGTRRAPGAYEHDVQPGRGEVGLVPERVDESGGVGVRSQQSSVVVDDGVDRTDPDRKVVYLVQVLHHRLLVWDSDVGAEIVIPP